MKYFMFLFVIIAGSSVQAQYLNSPNIYNTTQNGSSTTVNGMNTNTGRTWNTNIQNNGSMMGTDSKGNPWHYDSNTGDYQNYGTGERHNKRYGY